MYQLEVSAAANRDLNKLEETIHGRDFERLRNAIRSLMNEPRPQGILKIQGTDNAYRVRVGNYRIVYRIFDSANIVVLLRVARRNEATYRQ